MHASIPCGILLSLYVCFVALRLMGIVRLELM